MRDLTGNPLFPGIFPDYFAPIVRNGKDGVREMAMARWACPSASVWRSAHHEHPNVKSPHWRRWLKPESRCVVHAGQLALQSRLQILR
jgi:hypothetical protein